MKNKNNIKTVTIPSNWTNKQIDFYVKHLEKLDIKIIIEYI